jgi:hypothetical protein
MHLLYNKAHAWSGAASNPFEGGARRPDALKACLSTFGQGFGSHIKSSDMVLARRDDALHLKSTEPSATLAILV